MSGLNLELLNKLDYDSKFEIIKQHVKQLSLIEKLKFLHNYKDERLTSYFRNKLIIPVNYLLMNDYFEDIDEDLPPSDYIYDKKINITTDMFIQPIYYCYRKCDIPILEWWLYAGLDTLTNPENKKIDVIRLITQGRYDYNDTRYYFMHISRLRVLPDIEVFEWYARNNIELEGILEFFLYISLHNNLLKHAIWCMKYIKSKKKEQLTMILNDDNKISMIYFYIISYSRYTIFDLLLISGFPYNKTIYNLIKSHVEEEELTQMITSRLEPYNKKYNIAD